MVCGTQRTAIAGLLANWAGEAEQQTPQKLKWIMEEVKLNKIFVLAEARASSLRTARTTPRS